MILVTLRDSLHHRDRGWLRFDLVILLSFFESVEEVSLLGFLVFDVDVISLSVL